MMPGLKHRYLLHIVVLLFLPIGAEFSLSGQEVLRSSKIQARANRKNLPALGLPLLSSGEIDPAVWYKDGLWRGADSLSAPPFWVTETIDVESVVKAPLPSEIVEFCKEWAMERPQGPVHVVTGPLRGMQFVAVCTRSRSSLSWKSIGFIVPDEGLLPGKSVWDYSCSVNWIEWFIGYDLFPKLPPALQELVEEMTAAEHLCSFIEFDPLEFEEPEFEIDYEWEMDLHEIQ
jgi:hypothetical protein